MSCCAACSIRIPRSEILCRRCYNKEFEVKWPECKGCHQFNANCGEAGYQMCYPCFYSYQSWLNFRVRPIQHVARGFLARRLLKKHKSAKKIQALWRSHHPVPSVVFHAFCEGCGKEVNKGPPFFCAPCEAERV